MIYQTTMDNPTAEIISVPLEIYFKGRAEPVNSLVSFCFDTVHLTEDNLVESLTDMLSGARTPSICRTVETTISSCLIRKRSKLSRSLLRLKKS